MNRFFSVVPGIVIAAGFAASAVGQDVVYEKYTLPNGMTVILHEDRSLPVATVNIWYRVGAQDEPPGRSGFAHLFEHLMFMGTKRVPGNQFDVLMETGGGANNASTDLHRTNYFSWGPSTLLPTLLWLDADRLEDMGLQMNQEKLDKQRDVVRNELRQVVENAPYGKASEMVYKALYAPSHPYYYGVIGTHEDLEAANVANVKDFFANFYVPNNASLVVAGDFDSAAVRPLIDSLFGTLPAGQPVTRKYAKPAQAIPVKLDGVRRITAIDKVQLPKVEYTYHSPVAFGNGDAEMQLAAAVLADGNSSRLYKRLVIDEQIAAEVSAMQQGYPLGGMFQIAVLAKPDADLARVEALVDEELAKLIKDGPTAEELDRYKATIEMATLASLQSIDRKADRMNEYEYYWGEPNSFKRDLDRFRSATPAKVREWAEETIKQNARVIVRVLPEEPERAASPRDARPKDGATSEFKVPAPQTATLSNGLRVALWTRSDLPLVALHLVSKPGGALDAKGAEGRASLAAEMMTQGAGELDSLAFGDAVQAIGGSFSASTDHETLGVSMTVLKRNVERGVGLFADAVVRPRMEAKDWERVRSLRADDLRQALESPAAAATMVADRMVYGESNPYAFPAGGTVKSVEAMTLEQVQAARKSLVDPAFCTLLVAGDVTLAELTPMLERALGSWTGANMQPGTRSEFAIQPRSSLKLAIVDRPGATQTMIRFQSPGVKYTDPNRVKLRLLSTLLGGSFTSRLNQNLREDHGYTYGARSRYAMEISAGTFSAGASVQAEVTGAALREFMKEFNRLRAGDVSEDDARKVRETARNETVRGFQGLSGLLGVAETMLVNGLSFDTVAADMAMIDKVTAADLNAIAKSALPIESGVLVLVGDKALILEQIKDLGLGEPVFVDAEGNPVK
jgi:predicted Zn-dependent peptidase